MNVTLVLLTIVGTIGAIDVLYYHLYRFRLWSQPSSVAEEVTHLIRNAVFISVLLAVDRPAVQPWSGIVFGLFVLDLLNSVVDTLLERRSRAPLGGLPSGESLVHILSTFGTGLAVASYTVSLGTAPAPAEGILLWQLRSMIAMGVILLAIEGTLFVRALAARRSGGAPVAITATSQASCT